MGPPKKSFKGLFLFPFPFPPLSSAFSPFISLFPQALSLLFYFPPFHQLFPVHPMGISSSGRKNLEGGPLLRGKDESPLLSSAFSFSFSFSFSFPFRRKKPPPYPLRGKGQGGKAPYFPSYFPPLRGEKPPTFPPTFPPLGGKSRREWQGER